MKFQKLMCVLSAAALLAGCGAKAPQSANTGNGGSPSQNDAVAVKEASVKIEQTDAQKLSATLTQQDYGGLFTISLPEGWSLTVGGDEIYTWIRAYDPSRPDLQVFTALRSGYFLKNQQAKEFHTNYYALSGYQPLYGAQAAFIVLEPATLETFYQKFMDYCGYLAEWEPTFAGFEYPQISNFEVIESMNVQNEMSSVALDNKMIHGSYMNTLSQEKAEGMFSGTVVDLIKVMDPGFDCGFDTIYSLTAMTAPYGLLDEYSALLKTILSSIQYSDLFVQRVMTAQQITMENARAISRMTEETSNIIMDGWNSRQKSYDIMSQEYSDATLGYDRYLDTETNEVYKAELGVMDGYDGTRYQKIDQGSSYYTEPVAGYIVR